MNTNHTAPKAAGRWRLVGPLALATLFLAALGLLSANSSAAVAPPPTPIAAGGGEYVLQESDEMGDAERSAIEQTLTTNIRQLTQDGRLPAPRTTADMALDWPLLPAPGFSDPGYHAVTGYVDHNPAFPGQLQDFACGRRTYDTSGGYNHQGTDYYLWPFAWNKMDAGNVTIVAAAPGVIINKSDGSPDRSCSFNSNKWNAVYVRHEDGSIAWYGHMKQGSVTAKPIGATVATGEYLGLVGSSGNSTGPHLHLELHDASYQLIDPYAGSCNTRSATSWWRVQKPYNDSAVNKIMTGSAPVSFQSCPSPDIPNDTQYFHAGDIIYFTAFYRDQMNSQMSTYRLLRPDGSIYSEWNHNSTEAFYRLSYWWWAFEFGPDQPTGAWVFEVEFEGTVARHTFYLESSQSGTVQPTATPEGIATPTATPSPEPTRPWTGEAPYQLYMPVAVAAN